MRQSSAIVLMRAASLPTQVRVVHICRGRWLTLPACSRTKCARRLRLVERTRLRTPGRGARYSPTRELGFCGFPERAAAKGLGGLPHPAEYGAFSGSHSGEFIAANIVRVLRCEIARLAHVHAEYSGDEEALRHFLRQLEEFVSSALRVGGLSSSSRLCALKCRLTGHIFFAWASPIPYKARHRPARRLLCC
jgi:hypothetical protein